MKGILDETAPPPKRPEMVAFGANCSWWDLKQNVGTMRNVRPGSTSDLPCCPKCGGVLFEAELEQWWIAAETYEKNGHGAYQDYLEWAQGKCFPTTQIATEVWLSELRGVVLDFIEVVDQAKAEGESDGT